MKTATSKHGKAQSASGACSKPTQFDYAAELTWQKIMAWAMVIAP